MVRTDKPLDNPVNWSFRVGRLFDIDIRVHFAFLIFVVVMISLEIPRGESTSWTWGRVLIDSVGSYAILFFVVLVHELGHCFGARQTGGDADEILLWPLGGLAMTSPPHTARAHMITTVAGRAVNVIFCLLAGLTLWIWSGTPASIPLNPVHPMIPLDPELYFAAGEAQKWVMRFFGISYLLLLFNLLPIFPFDGGRIVQAALWPSKGFARSMEIATSTGMIGAIGVGLFALFIEQSMLLLMIAVFGYLTCWQQRRVIREAPELAGEFGYDFSKGYAAFDGDQERPPKKSYFERRREEKRRRQAEREKQMAEARARQVEEILKKISDSGIDSLSAAERKLLDEESRRKRSEP